MIAISIEQIKYALQFFIRWRIFSLFLNSVNDVSELIEVNVPILVDIKVLKNAIRCVLLVPKEATLI